MESWLRTRPVLVALLAMALGLAENTVAPWAPYYVLYAVAVTWLPLKLGTGAFRFRGIGVRWWLLALALPFVLQLLAGAWVFGLYPEILGAIGVTAAEAEGAMWSFPAALATVFVRAAARLGGDAATHQLAYIGFVTLWAGAGEELFYRGYLHETLRPRLGTAAVLLVAGGLFAVRHAVQLALLLPDYPWGAAFAWVVFAFVAGLAFGWLYEATQSLAPPILAHYLFNLIGLLGAAGGVESG